MDKRHIENNKLYKEHENKVDNIKSTLKKEVTIIAEEYELTAESLNDLNDFIQDKATLFRYLRKNNYDLPATLSHLLDIIQWRIRHDIHQIGLQKELLKDPLVYFHKRDKYNRPILIIHLSYLPKPQDLEGCLMPLIIFVLETARRLVWNISKERIEQNMDDPMIFEIVLLVDFKNANSIPTDIGLFKSLISLLRKYPGMVGTVHLINFSWVYQGLWQMCKIILSNEAKQKVNFPALKELKSIIEPNDLLEEFGGKDEFKWSIEMDNYYCFKYDSTLSRHNSNSSIYYDALSRSTSSFSLYNTPITSLTPVPSHSNLVMTPLTTNRVEKKRRESNEN
ncbi:hypothetical protein G6F37_008078 [Rhizopus arrhizus]|nr:hypothetical protein G6F38_008905 [Rhizopus arrhizus]KAG1155935.1 hypothetical protein G6F37_008078 [Rhizopus arrhizus]